MKKWKVANFKVDNFKPFESIVIDFEGASMITLDGPNGFGKTSIFDALELLFTGKIQRVVERNSNTISKGKRKTNFEDNLYWNKNKLGDIAIRIELVNEDTNESLFLVRLATVSDLTVPENNAPDNFSIFRLFRLEYFNDDNFNNEISDVQTNEILGANFLKNFSLLNYLEQGENRYLHSTSASDRKKGIEHLINTDKLAEQIEYYKGLENIVTSKYTGKEHTDKLKSLDKELKALGDQINATAEPAEFKRLSTSMQLPIWDLAEPMSKANESTLSKLVDEVRGVLRLYENKSEILIRLHNEKIDKFLLKEKDIKVTLRLGMHISRYEGLKLTKEKILNVNYDLAILNKPTDKLVAIDLDVLKNKVETVELKSLLNKRDDKIKKADLESQKLAGLIKAHTELLIQYKNCSEEEDADCPFCGVSWDSRLLLEEAARIAIEKVSDEIDSSGKELADLMTVIKACLDKTITILVSEKKDFVLNFNADLYDDLNKSLSKFEILKETLNKLKGYNVFSSSSYINDESILVGEFEAAKSTILESKKLENNRISSDWRNILTSVFLNISDLDLLSKSDFECKIKYLHEFYNKLNNDEHIAKKLEVASLTNKIGAGKRLKRKIVLTRKTLEDTAENYTKKMIGDIELLFHIYSGRLIQNYQRGLGLLIVSGDGKLLKFSTVESSEHDAILSMSSGQIAALGMAFFLTLNRVYATNPFILIDDPVQSMDEINIASLSDLLRVEFRDRQILLSNHEKDVSTFIRYKFKRAGLSQRPIEMLASYAVL